MQIIKYFILVNVIAFIVFKALINKSTFSYFVPFVLNTVAILIYCVIIPQERGDINSLFCCQVLNYIGTWFCQTLTLNEPVKKGTYSIKEDVKTTFTAFGLMIILTLLAPIFIAFGFVMLVYALVLALGRYIKRKRLEAQLM